MKEREKHLYMDFAKRAAEMSYAVRLKVGAVIARDHNILSYGWNGTPSGWDNSCETKDYMGDACGWLSIEEIEEGWPFEETVHELQSDETIWTHTRRYRLVTKPEVLHAERNALDKLAAGNSSGYGASLFVTHSPCIECAKSISSVGIAEVYYNELYRSDEGIKFLRKCGILVEQFGAR